MWHYALAALYDAKDQPEKAKKYLMAGMHYPKDAYLRDTYHFLRIYLDARTATYNDEYEQQLFKDLKWIAQKIKSKVTPEIYDKLREAMNNAYRNHELEIITFYNDVMTKYGQDFVPQELYADNNIVRSLERDVLLRVVDNKWIDHLHNIDMLREGIGLRAYGQKDPLIEYKKEAYDLYNNMMHEVQGETVKYLFRTKFGIQFVGDQNV